MFDKLPASHLIAAVIPCYCSQGDMTIILTTEGDSITTRVRIRTILRRLAANQATDLGALKKLINSATGQAILHPLPFTANLVLFPVKIRKPRIAGDVSIGYVNLHAVTAISKNKKSGTIISLSGGAKVSTLWTIATVKKHMQFARLAITQTAINAPSADSLVSIARKLAEIIQEMLLFNIASTPPATHTDTMK